MLKLLPLLYCWYRMGAFTRLWAAPGATNENFHAMRRATRTAFFIMLGFSLLGFIGPALLPVLRHSEGAQTFSTITVIAGFALSLMFDIKAELLRQRGRGEKRFSIYLPPAWLKKSERFALGVKKFLKARSDLMTPEKLALVQGVRREYKMALRNPDKAALEELEKKVLKTCESAVPASHDSPLKENVEVIVVAIIVALGIRAYYLQPFKIPTASMQPTLNGIIGTAMQDGEEKPNILTQAWQYVWNGRNYVECRVPEEWGEVSLTHFQQTSRANFFTFTTLTFSNGKTLTAYCPARQFFSPHAPPDHTGIGVNMSVMSAVGRGVTTDDNPTPVPFAAPQTDAAGRPLVDKNGNSVLGPVKLKGGDLIAKGYIESGDQLLVDKLSYHFRSPRRDEVFVFSTRDIEMRDASGRQLPPQHYIKRLVALPGDQVALESPRLLVNGEVTTAPGSGKVMASPKGYTSNLGRPTRFAQARSTGPVVDLVYPKPGYTALGDNSANSEDSRYWGPVWERNLVGPAMFVYWPFANHWGLIP